MISKTSKSFTKRFRVTKNGKIMHRSPNQNHFRAKKASKFTRHNKIQKPMAVGNNHNSRILERIPFR